MAAQRSQHGGQKQWQTTSTPKRNTHIHSVEQDQPQGMKNRGQNNEIHHIDKTSWKTPPDITAQTLQEAIPEN